MGVRHDVDAWVDEISDASKLERKTAIEQAGPLLNASRTTQLRRMLTDDCRLIDDTDINGLITTFTAAGGDDEIDVRDAIKTSLRETLSRVNKGSVPNDRFLTRETAAIFDVVNAAITERDAGIVRGGGPAKLKFMTRHHG